MTNKTPIYEYYGFVMYLASFVAFGIYLVWAYVPDEILHSLGITYYPKRYWALAIPIWLVTLVWFIFISFMSINLMNTAPLDSYKCITDEHAHIMRLSSVQADPTRPPDYMPELHDIPISVVNAFLYPPEPDAVGEQEEHDSRVGPSASTSAPTSASQTRLRKRPHKSHHSYIHNDHNKHEQTQPRYRHGERL
ncbi:PIG-P-domain-containing protein [Syncephalastrum racemosum]|uniref:PIG-P-domain-containing protein n=1 Tax=Syncephalastrum racemosum TaxID=13706 RepID=A0A1X2GZW7_SYNRA|nr:PIG-P-domain-containing protein [Syncephalastrum racemosum]